MKNVIYIAFNENVKEGTKTVGYNVLNGKAPFIGKNKSMVLEAAKNFARNNRELDALTCVEFYAIRTEGAIENTAESLGSYRIDKESNKFNRFENKEVGEDVKYYFSDRKIEMI